MNVKNITILLLTSTIVFLLAGIAHLLRPGWMRDLSELGGVATGHARAVAAEKADRTGRPIEIGVIGPWSYAGIPVTNMLRGVELAGRLINERGDLGRPVLLHIRDHGGSVATAKQQMQAFCENPDISAVIGGIDLGDFLAQRPLAEFNEMLFVSPSLTPDRDRLGAMPRFCFLTHTDSGAAVEAARGFMDGEGLKSVAILGPPELYYGYYLCNAFDRAMPRDRFGKGGVIDRAIYGIPVDPAFIRRTVLFWSDVITYDTLLLSGDAKTAGILFDAIKDMKTPPVILLTEETTYNQLEKMNIPTNLSVHLISSYDPRDTKPANLEFIKRYTEAYGEAPDWFAAQGFDALNVIVSAMRSAGSTVPERVAEAMRALDYTHNVSVSPRIAFDASGRIIHGKMVLLEAPE